jgi:competence protein ComEA
MVRHERIILLLIAMAVSIPAGIKTRQSVQSAALTGLSVTPSPRGFVHVVGDVVHPGMYPLFANMVTTGVIKMAIPLRPLTGLAPTTVTARQLKNGDDVHLKIGASGRGEVIIDALPTSERIIMGIPLNINAMVAADFDRLPGIGPVIAKRIVEYRQNNGGKMTREQLVNVEGIGKKKYGIIKKYF